MDCGPASLAALLGAHGLPANVDALRAVCATAVDGTSVDDLEEVAFALGLDAEQLVVPLAQVLALAEAHLPAILLTRTLDGYVHFVVAWRIRRGRVDLVDPAVGRRRVRIDELAREAFSHELEVPLDAWAQYALGEEAAAALVRRLQRGGSSAEHARARVAEAQRRGPVDGIGALLAELDPDSPPAVRAAGEDGDGDPLVRVRGAVLIRAPRRREDAEVPASLAHVVAAPRVTPRSQLHALVAAESRSVAVAAGLAALAGCAAVAETVSAQRVLESGAGGGRLAGLALAVAVALLATATFIAAALAAGRRIERRLRERLLARVARLGDGYVRSRPTGDLAERGHAIVLVRAAVELGTRALQRTVEVGAAAIAIVVLAPAAWPAALALAALAMLVPGLLVQRLAEADHRARSAQGAIALQLGDALGAADALRAHRAAPVLRALHAPLLSIWERAVAVVQRRYAAGVLALELAGLLAAASASALALHDGAGAAVALLIGVLGFAATTAAQELALTARRAVPLRNALARVLEPLAAELADPAPDVAVPAPGEGAAIELRDAEIVLGSTPVLRDVTLALAPGEHVAVVGPSGAGKSSLVAVLAGWLKPSAGTLCVDGAPLAGPALARLRRTTAWADGSTRLHRVSLAENADFGAHADAPPAGERLRLVGLGPACDRLGDAAIAADGAGLAATESQRLRFARALGRPGARLVLLDEALGDLPGDERRALVAHARETWRAATLLHVTHDVASAADFDRVLVIDGARIVEDGDPAALAADPESRYGALLASQVRLAARAAARAAGDGAPAPVSAPAPAPAPQASNPPARGVLRGVLGERAVAGPFALALLAGLAATIALVAAADRLGGAVREPGGGQLGWLVEVAALMAASAVATGAGAYLLGRAAVGLGRALRRRALAAAPHADRRTSAVGERIARVLDLEQLEATVLGSGALIGFALVEAAVAGAVLVAVGQPLAAALLALALIGALAAGRTLERRGSTATAARVAATAQLVGRLLALRTVTLQEDPAVERVERSRLLGAVQSAHARVDRGHVAIAAVLPRACALLMLAAVALDPPARPAAAAGVLGAILLALGALEMLGSGIAELAPAAAAVRGARPLLVAPGDDVPDPHGRLRAPEARAEHLLHQPLAANALLGGGCWPPSERQLAEVHARLQSVGLGPLVERMPLGLGQPLGETGWRLSGGERARLVLVRALMTGAHEIVVENALVALDPESAMTVLDALDDEPRPVTLAGASPAPAPPAIAR
jgi:ATP-binding cassette subfamily B protein